MALKALYHTLSIEICSAFQEERARSTDLARCTAPSTQPQRANTQLCSSKASHNFYHIYPARNTQRLANDQHDSHCDKTVIRLMVSPKMTSSGPTTQEKWDSEIHARRKSSWPKLSWPNQPRTTTWEIARGMTTNVGCSVGRKEEKGEHLKLRTGGLVEGRRRWPEFRPDFGRGRRARHIQGHRKKHQQHCVLNTKGIYKVALSKAASSWRRHNQQINSFSEFLPPNIQNHFSPFKIIFHIWLKHSYFLFFFFFLMGNKSCISNAGRIFPGQH